MSRSVFQMQLLIGLSYDRDQTCPSPSARGEGSLAESRRRHWRLLPADGELPGAPLFAAFSCWVMLSVPPRLSAMKFLLVFDFDHTIVDENSDTWIVKCAPEKKLPNGLRNSYRPGHWTEYMGRVFVYLGDNGVKEDEMRRTMTTIPFTAGMVDLLGFIGKNKELFDCIIVSDSNTVFIDWILKAADFHKVFDEVFTNPAAFSSTGYLTVQNFHAHHCEKCPKNLCKRKVLKEFLDKQLERGVSYTQIVYIGDGGNDLCPVMFLKKDDIAMPRQGYTLEKKISQLAQDLSRVECSVLAWSSAIDIMSYLKQLLKE